jgi:hypothetical protein
VRELAELEVDQHEAPERAIVEDEVDIEVVALEREPLLARHEAEALAHLEQEVLKAIDDRLLEVALMGRRLLAQVEELENEGVLDDVAW